MNRNFPYRVKVQANYDPQTLCTYLYISYQWKSLNWCFWQLTSNIPSKTLIWGIMYSLNPTLLEIEELGYKLRRLSAFPGHAGKLRNKRLIVLLIDAAVVLLLAHIFSTHDYINQNIMHHALMHVIMITSSKYTRANKSAIWNPVKRTKDSWIIEQQ